MTIALTIGGKGFSGLNGSSFSSSSTSFRLKNNNRRKNGTKVICSSSSVMDPYKTLNIRRNSSEYEVKQAFRQLAKKYHPDVCKGSNCGVQFQTINEAYEIVLKKIKNQLDGTGEYEPLDECEQGYKSGYDEDNLWEEWMGWEGAGIRDYSSHINPYI